MGVNQNFHPPVFSLSVLAEKLLEKFLTEKEYRFYAYSEKIEVWFSYTVYLLKATAYRRYSLSVKEERYLSALTSQVVVLGCSTSYLTCLISQLGNEAEYYLKKHAHQIHYSPKEVLSIIELVRQFIARCHTIIERKENIVLLPPAEYRQTVSTVAD
ncbi:hypothetical protein KP77_09440 [Jeotgalibacillus alimentarius]|uniref:Uncharacterized protein n=1 Tax=Jeotgalibacillus alimentarius TaxID=135826 RepID=A0A0C2VR84_9BACL|nr:hypothetical protein [Jeotgalibacillus alimentarius]KIL51432.1 hypothetical protein KP77_09440 [Jeotgalibacillus alimentarius]